MTEPHKNKSRASLTPLNAPTLALSCLGLGFLRPAPGTWGSLPPCAICALLILLDQSRAITPALVCIFVLSCIACILWGAYGESRFGRKDAPEVVIDETAGQALTLAPICVPALAPTTTITWLIALAAAFLFFRAADIFKPPPARRLERLPAGWGVLADDLAAAVYAAAIFALGLWMNNNM